MSATAVVQQPGYPLPGGYPPPDGDYPQQPPGGYPPPMAMAPVGQQQVWMPIPLGIPNCPPGLESLMMINQLLLKQHVESLEAFKYTVSNSMGQKIYFGYEVYDDCLSRFCGSFCRSLDIEIWDNSRNEVVHLYRPVAFCGSYFDCCLPKMDVFAPPGMLIGRIKQTWGLCGPKFAIENANGDVILKIRKPLCPSKCCDDIEFKVMALDGETQVGQISKLWTGLGIENFEITFPLDLDVNVKAVMLGACILIHLMCFDYAKYGNFE